MDTNIGSEQELVDKIAAVEAALVSVSPALQLHMTKLHAHLKKQPELVHLLTDEQICSIVTAYTKLTNSALSEITPASKQSASGASKSKKSFSALDLGLDLG